MMQGIDISGPVVYNLFMSTITAEIDYSNYDYMTATCNYCHYPNESCECCSECGFYPCLCELEI